MLPSFCDVCPVVTHVVMAHPGRIISVSETVVSEGGALRRTVTVRLVPADPSESGT